MKIKVQVYHVRAESVADERGEIVGTVAIGKLADTPEGTDIIGRGVSIVNIRDNPNKKIGLTIAIKRLLKAFTTKESTGFIEYDRRNYASECCNPGSLSNKKLAINVNSLLFADKRYSMAVFEDLYQAILKSANLSEYIENFTSIKNLFRFKSEFMPVEITDYEKLRFKMAEEHGYNFICDENGITEDGQNIFD